VTALRKGAFDYLRKPFEHDELLNTVRNALTQVELERKRKDAEQELLRAHKELERRVEERTADLAKANEQLRQEIEIRKKAEEQLQQTNEEVRNFVHIVSHDLKNPIISIQGFSARLMKKYEDALEENGRGYVNHIMSNARRMELLVSDLLTLSLIGRVRLDFGNVCCKGLIDNLAANLQARLKKKRIDLHVKHELPTVYSCHERLYQVFENLLVNAVKFIGNPETPRIDVGHREDGNFHIFYVRDNGIGIDPKHHERIFEMFCRLKRSEDEEGTGLGLPIVHKIVATLGGRVWVESEVNEGATFLFTLPKHRPSG
jgi:signal transduction histidine kinase